MSVAERLIDAQHLADADRLEGALAMVLVAVAATSKKRYPGRKNDKKSFVDFLSDEMIVVLRGAGINYFVRDMTTASDSSQPDSMRLERVIYEHFRCPLIHEGRLDDAFRFHVRPDRNVQEISIEQDTLSLSFTWMNGFARAVRFAPENFRDFPEISNLNAQQVGVELFGNRSDRAACVEYLNARRKKLAQLREQSEEP